MNDTFENIIGQDGPKKELGFYLNSYLKTRIVPNMLFVAPKGQGKTTIAQAVAKGLYKFDEAGEIVTGPSRKDPAVIKPKCKDFLEINCADLKNVKQFINGTVARQIQDKDVTVFFDEASELPHCISMALLTILNPNPTNRTSYSTEDYTVDFDFARQTFLFATSEVHKVFHALRDRLERITLQEYTPNELGRIVQQGVPAVSFKEDVLQAVSSVLRGNARGATMMATKIATYLCGATEFTPKDWGKLQGILSIHPLGLNAIEIQVLRFLAGHIGGTSLTCLSAKTGMSRASLQQDSELYLMKHNLLEVQTTGRVITKLGLDYLKALPTT